MLDSRKATPSAMPEQPRTRAGQAGTGRSNEVACPASSSRRPTSLYKFVSHTHGLTHKSVIDGGCSASSTGQANCQPLHRIQVRRGDLALEVGPLTWWFSALVHLHKAWNLGRSEVGWILSTSPLQFRRRFGRMMNGRRIRLTSCSWCAAKWGWPQPARSTRWHGGWCFFFQLAGAGAAGGPGTSTAGGNDGTWSPSAAPVASVPAAPPPPPPPPVAHPVIPPFQFARLGLAAKVPDEVIQPVHDLAQKVVPLRGDELSSFLRDAIRREAIALAQACSVPPASCAAAPVTAPTLLPPAPPAAPAPVHQPAPPTVQSLTPALLPPPPLLEKLRTGMSIFILFCTLARAAARRSILNRSCIP